jgi:hypothetical protein
MSARFAKGQKVVVRKVKKKYLSPRDSALEPYVGQIGTVDNYYCITLNRGNTVYLYTIRIGTDQKEIVLHEDELDVCKASLLKDA